MQEFLRYIFCSSHSWKKQVQYNFGNNSFNNLLKFSGYGNDEPAQYINCAPNGIKLLY